MHISIINKWTYCKMKKCEITHNNLLGRGNGDHSYINLCKKGTIISEYL